MPPGNDAVAPGLFSAAAERLGLDLDLEPHAVRSAILRQLRDTGFFPDPAMHEAVWILHGRTGGHGALSDVELAADEQRVRGELDAFADQFFKLALPDRQSRWNALDKRCARHPALSDRLQRLARALRVDRRAYDGAQPAVARLVDDVLTLCVLRPWPRAAMARELARSYLNDSRFTDRERARARLMLERRHPEIAALGGPYLARLAAPNRTVRAARRRSTFASALSTPPNQTSPPKLLAIGFVGAVVVCMIIVALGMMFENSVSRVSSTSQARLQKIVTSSVTPPGTPPTPAMVAFFRDQFKEPIKRELAKVGKTIDEAKLQKVVDFLPANLAAVQTGLAMRVLVGMWSPRDHDQSVVALERGLKDAGLGLSDEQIKAVARASVPKPSAGAPSGGPAKGKTGPPRGEATKPQ